MNYLYKEAVQRAKNLNMLAYSHRRFGWSTERFELDNDFRIKIDTNFGYGWASYFLLTLFYKDIPIIPYTKIIYYQYVNASNLLNYTQDYSVDFNSWNTCYEFVVNAITYFNNDGKSTFVRKHIIESVEELMVLIDKIMHTDIFYFVDMSKIDSYLDLKGRNIIYDYEHFLNNVNHSIINEDALKIFVEEYEKLNFHEDVHQDSIKRINELSNFVLNNAAKSELNNGFNKERYGYAIAMLLSKYGNYYESWRWINDDIYNDRIQKIVSKILDIKSNYKLLLYRKSGIELLLFRNERIQLTTKLFNNLEGLNDLVDAQKYIKQIRRNALIMIEQNNTYLNDIEPLLLMTKANYESENSKYLQEQEKIKQTIESKQICYYHDFLNLLEQLFVSSISAPNEGNLESEEAFDTIFSKLISHIRNSESSVSLSKKQLFILNGLDSNNTNDAWSVKVLRDRYIKSNKNEDKLALELINAIINKWHETVLIFQDNIDMQKIKDHIRNNLNDIENLSIELHSIVSNTKSYMTTFDKYKDSYFQNQSHYLDIKLRFDGKMKVVEDLKSAADKYREQYQKLLSNKDKIEEYSKILKESIKWE